MKRLLCLLLFVASLSVAAFPQGQNFSGSGSGVTITTVAGLATVPNKTAGTLAVVTNGSTATDCTAGGGANIVICQYSGSTWAIIAAASSGATAFSAITAATNTNALLVGTGGSFGPTGTGTVTANAISGTPSITVNALTATTINGAALSGTFSGNPTFSGTPVFSNVPTLPSQAQNLFFASPNGSSGVPTFRAIVAADIPTLNQSTTGNATTATNLTGCVGSTTGDVCVYSGGWTRLAGNTVGTKFLQETSTGVASWVAGTGSGGSLDQISGAAAQATATETAALHQYQYNGVETAALTAPVAFTNGNSTNNNTSIGLLFGATGTSTGGIGGVVFDVSGTGDIFRAYSGGSVANGVYTVGTLEFNLTATGNGIFAGGIGTGGVTPPAANVIAGISFLDDTNSNKEIGFTATSTAVDYVNVTNAATANPATVAVGGTGSDSNVNLNLTSKGTGVVQVNGNAAVSESSSVTTAGEALTSTATANVYAPTDLWLPQYVPAANCNNTTAGAGWSIPSGGTVTCRAGTNNLGGYITITDTSTTFAQFTTVIPFDWDTASNPYIRFYLASASDTTNGHTVIPQVKVSCSQASNGTTSDDATFSAAQSSSTITFGGSAVANGFYSGSNVQLGSTQMSGCVAGGLFIVQVGRATDTATGNINFYGASLSWPHKTPGVAQAN